MARLAMAELSTPDVVRPQYPPPPPPQPRIATNGAAVSRDSKSLSIEALRNYLAHRGGRTTHVAQQFGVSEEEVERLIKLPGSGIRVAERGWLKLA